MPTPPTSATQSGATQSGPPQRTQGASARRRAYLWGGGAALVCGVCLLSPRGERLIAKGPSNTGHEELRCAECHQPARGTFRQRAQANARALLGLRPEGAPLVSRAVGNAECEECHAREEDAHAPHRFEEPRFAEARALVEPRRCVSCHAEHQGARVTRAGDFCGACHDPLKLSADPLDVSHERLAAEGRFETCLTCHDYHGNHAHAAPRLLARAYPLEEVSAYMRGGPSPYGEPVTPAAPPPAAPPPAALEPDTR